MKRLGAALAAVVLFGLSAVTTSASPAPSTQRPAPPLSPGRSVCQNAEVPTPETEVLGQLADRAEELQNRYEGDKGFLAVLYAGEEFWVVVQSNASDRLLGDLRAEKVQIAESCVPVGLIEATQRAAADVELSGNDFTSVAYNVFTDSIDVKTTIDPESLRDRTAAIFGPTTKQVLDATLHVDKSVAGRSFRLAGRLADSAPFFGRAKAFFPSQDCSTGFYVNSATNGTVMLSAGQCGTNGQTVRNGNQTLTVGTVEGRRFPNPDLLVIDGQLYSARSFSANNTTSSKAIRSSNNPTTGVTYCQMGFVSQRICSTYSSLSAQYCDESGCTTGLAFTSRACTSPLGQPGDSGGGVFKEMADGTLGARGTVVAGAQISPTQCARYDHRLTTILSTYDAVVVVS